MKRTIAIVTAIFAFTLSAAAAPRASGLISKQELASESSKPISNNELASMIANAKTPAEHQQLADYYHALSRSLLAESNKHAQMRAEYGNNRGKGVQVLIDHCSYLTRDLKAASEKAAKLASDHEQMAKVAAQ